MIRSATAYKNEYRTIMNTVFRITRSSSLGIAHIGEHPIWDIPDKEHFLRYGQAKKSTR